MKKKKRAWANAKGHRKKKYKKRKKQKRRDLQETFGTTTADQFSGMQNRPTYTEGKKAGERRGGKTRGTFVPPVR